MNTCGTYGNHEITFMLSVAFSLGVPGSRRPVVESQRTQASARVYEGEARVVAIWVWSEDTKYVSI